jgi:hypothetical protein
MHCSQVYLNGNKGDLVEVNGEPNSRGELIDDMLKVGHMLRDCANNDEGIIHVY